MIPMKYSNFHHEALLNIGGQIRKITGPHESNDMLDLCPKCYKS